MEISWKPFWIILTGVAALLVSSCGAREPACQWATGTPRYMTVLPPGISPATTATFSPSLIELEIGGREILVDQIVEGPLCNGNWSGIVYVSCNVQVFPWEENPTFLKDCNLSIEPGTIVYVAYHNDTAYYNGCSCHTGEIPEP